MATKEAEKLLKNKKVCLSCNYCAPVSKYCVLGYHEEMIESAKDFYDYAEAGKACSDEAEVPCNCPRKLEHIIYNQ